MTEQLEAALGAEPRRFPYIWATWLAADIGGDTCAWKAWLKAHFKYRKRADDGEGRLVQWAADHDAAVRARARELEEIGHAVRLEGQNKFHVQGTHAVVGGQADILALGTREQAGRSVRIGGDLLSDVADVAVVEDVKTGRRRESDYWQVVVYLVMLPIAFKDLLTGRDMVGRVVYPEGSHSPGEREVLPEPAHRQRLLARIREIGSGPEPRRTPSARECKFCDIAGCPDRAPDESTATTTTELF